LKRTALALLAAAAVAGCGDDDISVPSPPVPDVVEERVDEAQKAIDKLDETDLPEDAKRELEEAKRLLDEAQP